MKKNLFKLTACVLTTLSVGALASCGEEEKPLTETVEINVWATAQEEAVITKVVDEWNKNHEVANQFKVKFTAVQEGDAGTTLAKDPTVKDAPALFLCADDHIATLKSKNIVSEIKGTRREKIEADNMANAVAGVTQDDKVWGYPVTSDNGYFLWYNKTLLPADKLNSLEAILGHAKDTNKTFLMELNNGWYANSFIMAPEANGIDSLKWTTNAEGQKIYNTNWDNEVAVKVSQYVSGLIAPHYETGTFVSGSNEAIVAGFQDGTMLAAVSGTWMENDLKAAIGAENLGAVKLPTFTVDGKAYQMASFGGTKVYCLNKTRPIAEQKTAAALAELLTNKESQLVRFETRASLPCNKEAAVDPRYTEHVSIGGAALNAQSPFACVQSQVAEDRYWDIGKAIGQAYLDGNIGEGNTWAKFLKDQMDILRKPNI